MEATLISTTAIYSYSFTILIKESCYRSLISRLEEVDPRKLKQDEKLAFWINIHNALVMHVMVHTSKLLN